MSKVNNATAIALAAVCGPLAASSSALAYSKPGHHEITNGAYQVMRAFTATSGTGSSTNHVLDLKLTDCTTAGSACGRVVTQPEWDTFRANVDWARRWIGSKPHQVPNDNNWSSPTNRCWGPTASTDLAELPIQLTADHHDLMTNQCGATMKPEELGEFGLYNELTVTADGNRKQGYGLGYHAKNRDDDLNETVVEVPVGVQAGIPQAMEGAARVSSVLGAAAFAPFACLVKLFSNTNESCLDIARRWSDKTNLAGALYASIPGFGLPQDELFIGFWHLINVQRSGRYHDHPGMDLANNGPSGQPGAMDTVIRNATELTSARINAFVGTGDDRYQYSDTPRGIRNVAEWRMHDIGLTEFSPLDNLARYGWETYASQPVFRLGWPLHAIGDSTVPMHVVGTPGHGHAVYEEWVEANWRTRLLYADCTSANSDCTPATQRSLQAQQARRVLNRALRWRDRLNSHNDVRQFITELAEQTLAKVGNNPDVSWPWCDVCDVFWAVDEFNIPAGAVAPDLNLSTVYKGSGVTIGDIARNPAAYYNTKAPLIRDLVEDAMAAKIAFLTWSTPSLNTGVAAQCIGVGSIGCNPSAANAQAAGCCNTASSCHSSGRCQTIQ